MKRALRGPVHGTKITAKKPSINKKKMLKQLSKHKLTCDSACDIIVRTEQCDGTYTMKRIPTTRQPRK